MLLGSFIQNTAFKATTVQTTSLQEFSNLQNTVHAVTMFTHHKAA